MAKTTDSASVTPIKKRKTTAYVPTEPQRSAVRMAAAAGYRDVDICRLIATDDKEITAQTLRKYFSRELQQGKPRADLAVVSALYKLAVGVDGEKPNVAACIFWAKTRLGWRERAANQDDFDSASKPRGALIVPGVYDVTNWEAAAQKAAAGMEGLRRRALGEAANDSGKDAMLKPAA